MDCMVMYKHFIANKCSNFTQLLHRHNMFLYLFPTRVSFNIFTYPLISLFIQMLKTQLNKGLIKNYLCKSGQK